jgi:hypothetical protein
MTEKNKKEKRIRHGLSERLFVEYDGQTGNIERQILDREYA